MKIATVLDHIDAATDEVRCHPDDKILVWEVWP